MMTQPKTPTAFNGDNIPASLKANARWAPWKAVWNEKREKFDKVPCNTQGYGLSTAKPERWYSYEAAHKAYTSNPLFAGVGYVMTGPHGVVGVDLDGCVKDDTIDDWAQEVIDSLASYTELSPSGKGLRILVEGEIESDWTNHEVGIEVYGGLEPRFLTVTGMRLKKSVDYVNGAAPSIFEGLATTYAKVKSASNIISLQLPDLVDELVLPDVADLGLPYQASDFLSEGAHRGDRSRELFATAVSLYAAGLADDVVLSMLANNEHAFEVAMSHRRYDHDRALMYLWVEHCQKAKGRATSKVASADDFEDVSTPTNTPKPHLIHASAAPLSIAKPMRFNIQQAAAFTRSEPLQWLIKGVLPVAEVAAVIGESGSGKTFFVLDLMLAIATGTPWRGRKVKQGPVLYICAEGAGGFQNRLTAYAKFHGLDLAAIPLYVLGDAPNLMEKGDVKDLLEAIAGMPEGITTICADTWAQMTAGANENSGEDMGRALSHCKVLRRKTGAMVVLVAHTGKVAERGMRGWSGVKGALDTEITVEKSLKYHSAKVTKMKDGDAEGEEFAFSLQTVQLEPDPDGDAVSSCVVQVGNHVPKAERKAEPKGSIQQVVLRKAVDLTDLPGEVATSQLVDASVEQMPIDEEIRGTKKDRRREKALTALEALVAANRISIAGGFVNVL